MKQRAAGGYGMRASSASLHSDCGAHTACVALHFCCAELLQGGGVHGNAILTKFDIQEAAVVPHRQALMPSRCVVGVVWRSGGRGTQLSRPRSLLMTLYWMLCGSSTMTSWRLLGRLERHMHAQSEQALLPAPAWLRPLLPAGVVGPAGAPSPSSGLRWSACPPPCAAAGAASRFSAATAAAASLITPAVRLLPLPAPSGPPLKYTVNPS